LKAHLYILLCVLAIALVSSPSLKAELAEEEAAKLLYEDGKTSFEKKEHLQALTLFQQAYEVLQNDFIRFYLGRTHAALNQCNRALEHFATIESPLPSAPKEERRKVEVQCRLEIATRHLDTYRCHEALELLKPIDRELRAPESRRRFSALQATAKACTDVFGTRTSLGQEAARYYAEARSALRAGRVTESLTYADKSLASKPSRPAASVEAIALGRLGRCQAAIHRLDSAIPHANSEDAHIMDELVVRCRLSEAKRLLKGGTCYDIIAMLDPLKGKLSGQEEIWRKQKVNWCRPHATAFALNSAPRKAAYKLYQAAKEAFDTGTKEGAERSMTLLIKALKLVHEPVIYRELARIQALSLGCSASLETLNKLAPEALTSNKLRLQELCQRYPPHESLASDKRREYVSGVMEVLALRNAGVYRQALARLTTLTHREAPALRALRLDLVYGAGRCEDYVDYARSLNTEAKGFARDLDARVQECTQVNTPKPEDKKAEPSLAQVPTPLLKSQSSPSSRASSSLVAWSTIGSGAALGALGVTFALLWADGASRYDDARVLYQEGSADEALLAVRRLDELDAEASLYSGLSIGFGVAGALALGLGIALLVDEKSGPEDAKGRELDGSHSRALYPLLSPSYVGIGGQF